MTDGSPLSRAEIDAVLPDCAEGLAKYCWLQQHRHVDSRTNSDFRRRFNGFYRVRRPPAWQDVFYDLLERTKRDAAPNFQSVLGALHEATDRYEASFASKLLATVDPEMPVIDSVVLHHLGLRLPWRGSPDRLKGIIAVHVGLHARLRAIMQSDIGHYPRRGSRAGS